MFGKLITILLLFACSLFLLPACSRQSTQAAGKPQQGKDYRVMLERSRQRNKMEHMRQEILGSIQAFQSDLGRLPNTLNELVLRGYMDEIPPPPDGMTYEYSPVSGTARIVRIRPSAE